VNFKRVDDGYALGAEFGFELLDARDAFDHEAQVIQLAFFRGFEEIFRYLVEGDVVAAGREIGVLRIRLPNHIHAKNLLIEFFRARDISDFKRDMAHALKPINTSHVSTIAQPRPIADPGKVITPCGV
jgi:hypothetical protein